MVCLSFVDHRFAVVVATVVCAAGMSSSVTQATKVTLSNTALPSDTKGHPLISGEADVLQHNGSFYFYFNNWGDCPGVDCCGTKGGCWTCCQGQDCTFFDNHTIVAYKSDDLKSFEPLGVVFDAANFSVLKDVVMFRPHVLYNAIDNRFVMWYKVKSTPHYYGVAVAESPAGPFTVQVPTVPHITGVVSDHFLFQDENKDAYFVKEGSVVKLNASFTGVDLSEQPAQLPVPASWEAPVMFSKLNTASNCTQYFVIGGHNCCACKGGSNAYVMTAMGNPLANWTYIDDLGDNKTQCALQNPPVCTRGGHSPLQWIDHAQTSAAFTVMEEGMGDMPTTVLLSNQWVTAPPPKHARNADLLYFNAIRYDSAGRPQHFIWEDELVLDLV